MPTLTETIQPKLTAYNVDGLELFFTVDRKVRASQSAMARMCRVSEATVRNRCLEPIVKNNPGCNVILAQTSSTGGGKQSKLHNSQTIKILLKEFNPTLLEQFLDFGIDEGFAQMCGVPLPQPTQVLSCEDQLILMAENAIKWAKLQKALLANPGDKRQLDATIVGANFLEDRMTLAEMSEMANVKLDVTQSRVIGSMLAGCVKCRKEESEIPKASRKYTDDSGKVQYTKVNNYPLSMYSNFVSACKAFDLM